MERYLQQFMDVCSTVVQLPDNLRQLHSLAVEAVKIKNEAALDLSNPTKLCVDGINPFYEACRSGNFPIVKLFIANGANVNVLDRNGVSPLYSASASYHCTDSTVYCLLDAGADVHLYREGRNPLLASFYNMKINTSIRLIQKGADVNNAILPSFCFVESVFALNSNLVIVASGVQFQLERFDQLMKLSTEIIKAGLSPRTFYMTGRKSFQNEFTSSELSALWQFQSLCLAVGFKVDRYSLNGAILELHRVISEKSDSCHLQSLYKLIENYYVMDQIISNPLTLTRLARISLRTNLASIETHPGKHLDDKIDMLPLPKLLKDFVALKEL